MVSMEKIVAFCKDNGLVFQGSEIYGGLANSWDYGPVGIEMLRNVKDAWWHQFVHKGKYNVGLDAGILMNTKVWEASGHIKNFGDPLTDCKNCKTRHRADKLIEQFSDGKEHVGGWSFEKMMDYINVNKIKCPNCGKCDFTPIRQFKLMLKTHLGVIEDEASEVYLRPETAQGEFVNFKNVQRSMRLKLPFGITQIGKAFRNEITPGNFIFRTREFEQMEQQFFYNPCEKDYWYPYWKNYCYEFLQKIGVNKDNLQFRQHDKEELAHYCKLAFDIEYKYPFGWGELWGIHDRTDFDIKNHQEKSGVNMEYFDPLTNEKIMPFCVETSVGANRLFLVLLLDAYHEETLENGETRVVLKIHPAISAYKVAVLPLNKKKHTEKAQEILNLLSDDFSVTYDEAGSIGKRYRRQDEIGTPFCVTIDDETLEKGTLTIRERDSMKQITLPISDIPEYVRKAIKI